MIIGVFWRLPLTALPDSWVGFLQLVTVVIIFVIVLGITLVAVRLLARYQRGAVNAANIELVETFRLTNTKYVQILRVGKKYLAVAIGRDEVTKLCELAAEDLRLVADDDTEAPSFAAIMAKFKKTPATDAAGVDEHENS